MRLMRRRAFDFQTCGLCQHTFPAPESNVPRTRTLRDFLVDPARDDTIRSFLESGHDKPTRTALVDFPGQTFAIAYCFDGYNTSDQLPVCEACISHLDRKAAPRIPPCCIKACDVSDPLPPGLVPPRTSATWNWFSSGLCFTRGSRSPSGTCPEETKRQTCARNFVATTLSSPRRWIPMMW